MPRFPYPVDLAAVPALDPRDLHVFAVPLVERFRGITVREGVLLEGPAGWGEFCPFVEYDDDVAVPWLATALEAAWLGWPAPVRSAIEVNATVPAVSPERAAEIVHTSGARTAKVKVADVAGSVASLRLDADRVRAVRAALGPGGHVRVDANGRWDVEEAVHALAVLDDAAGGLQYAEQPCASVAELAAVRARTRVPIAADESIRRAEDPLAVAVAGAADIAVLKCTPLGGVRRALAVAERLEAVAGLPVVVSSALETGVGLAAELALAGALPRLELACGVGTLALLAGDLAGPAGSAGSAGPDGPDGPDGPAATLRVPTSPPAPDPHRLEQYAQRDPERVRWWRERTLRTHERLRAALTG